MIDLAPPLLTENAGTLLAHLKPDRGNAFPVQGYAAPQGDFAGILRNLSSPGPEIAPQQSAQSPQAAAGEQPRRIGRDEAPPPEKIAAENAAPPRDEREPRRIAGDAEGSAGKAGDVAFAGIQQGKPLREGRASQETAPDGIPEKITFEENAFPEEGFLPDDAAVIGETLAAFGNSGEFPGSFPPEGTGGEPQEFAGPLPAWDSGGGAEPLPDLSGEMPETASFGAENALGEEFPPFRETAADDAAPRPGDLRRNGFSAPQEKPEFSLSESSRGLAEKIPAEKTAVLEEPGNPGEARNRRKTFVELRDLRTAASSPASGAVSGQEGPGGEKGGDFPGQGRGNEAELVLELRSQARSQADSGPLRESRPVFRDLLARELRENLNGDIVRQASFMLRDGGSGIIRLTLRPESLGNVKIRLDLTENKITGLIVVESEEALRAFQQEIASLEQAFRDSGYEGASLQMSVAGDGGQDGPGREAGRENPWFSERLALSSYEDNASWEGDADLWTMGDGGVNVFA